VSHLTRRARSAGSQIRLLVGLLVVLVPLGAAITLVELSAQATTVRGLTLAVGPALESNTAVLLEMTRARSVLVDSSVRSSERGAALQRHRAAVDALLDTTAAATRRPEIGWADQEAYRSLTTRLHRSVERWFAAAAGAIEAPPGEILASSAVAAAWADFAAANSAVGDRLREARTADRAASRTAITTLSAITLTVTAITVTALLVAGLMLRRWVVRPLARLGVVVRRRTRGDEQAVADTDTGALEVRELAKEFNALGRANAAFAAVQREELRMRQLVLEVARGVRDAGDVPAALDGVCRDLGAGLAADRALLYTADDDSGAVLERSQWHRESLPDLPPVPHSLAKQVRTVAEQLQVDGGAFVIDDVFDSEWAQDPRLLGFRRATGARSLVLAPLGSSQHGVGVLALLSLDGPRWWQRHETSVIEQCAALAGQAVEQLRLAELREEQVRRLTELDHQKTDFMATVSHELRTPLTSINGYLELLHDGDFGPLGEEQRMALGIVERNATRLRGLIEDLLVLNRIESAGLQATLERVPVGELVECVVETLEPTSATAQVGIVAHDVPPELVVHVDRTQCERALINLGANAVKFTPPGGTVTIAAQRDADAARITINDTGIGIPAHDLTRISERFFRAGNARSAAIPGTGLGLAIVRSIIEGHGGHVGIESVEGAGTTVTVTLPFG
jgi:signal transduction histidine kinase/HAMP domain-containing protein